MSTDTLTKQAPPDGKQRPFWDRYFEISKRGSTVGRELRGGLTTFMAMSYIVLLNPLILSGAKDKLGQALSFPALTAMTAFSAGIMTIIMGAVGRVPLAMAAGLGVNAVVAYQVAPQVTWPQAMGLVVVMGLIIVLLAVSGIRERIMGAIPLPLKHAIGAGIGMFIALIGLVDAGFVTRRAEGVVPVDLGHNGALAGWPVVVFCIGLLLMLALFARKVPGAILISIAGATVLAIVIEAITKVGSSAPKGKSPWGLVTPEVPKKLFAMPDFSLFGKIDPIGGLTKLGVLTVITILFTLVLAGFFDAIGTIMGVSQRAGLVDEKGNMPGQGRALMIDGIGAAMGGVTSSSANTVFVESNAGVGEGARTGLASVVTGALFGATMFLVPLALVVPQQASAPALVLVGALMLSQVRHIDWNDVGVAIPAFLTVALMPFTYSIAAGVGAGLVSYTLIKVAQGRWREPGWMVWITSVFFVAYFAINAIRGLAG